MSGDERSISLVVPEIASPFSTVIRIGAKVEEKDDGSPDEKMNGNCERDLHAISRAQRLKRIARKYRVPSDSSDT